MFTGNIEKTKQKFIVFQDKHLKFLMTLLFGVGFGVALHDFAHALWQVGEYSEILSYQGGYIGFVLMLVAFIVIASSSEKSRK
jgi:L-cystine uptake protein TcyP (sodium:dicarboxylate symporter family)